MIAFLRKNLPRLISNHTSSLLCRSPVSFSLSPHLFSSSTETQLGINEILVHKHNFPAELASRVALELSNVKNPKKADSILSFFKESGFSNTQLVKIVKSRPRILAASLDKSIEPKIKIFGDMGFSSDDIFRIISSNPAILQLSVNKNIIPSLSVMKGLLRSDDEVAGVVRKSPWILTVNLDNTLVPNVEFLRSYGIPMEQIYTIFNSFPSFFLFKPEIVRKSVDKAREMGLNGSSKSFIYGVRAIASIRDEAWELKLQAFRDFGFSESEILTMFRKAPTSFCVSIKKIKKIKEMLLATGKFDISSIVDYPMTFLSSIENRYIPRLRVLGILESRNLIKDWPNLSTICMMPDDKFYKKFISPYVNEISDVFITTSSSKRKKEMKP